MTQKLHSWPFISEKMKTYIHINVYKQMLIAALFVIAKHWNELRYLLTDKWLNKLWYIRTIEYYSTIKRTNYICNNVNESLGNYAEWKKKANHTSLDNITFHLYNILKWQPFGNEGRIGSCQVLGVGGENLKRATWRILGVTYWFSILTETADTPTFHPITLYRTLYTQTYTHINKWPQLWVNCLN